MDARVLPRNVVVVLLDSLNRHMVGAYGGTEFATPNLDRFAARSTTTRFDGHHTGSLPCMPARHDILCGALDFLWRPWGSIEVWEEAITASLRRAGVTSMLVSDHPHLFETGGENYHTDFTAWEYERGHEGDPWRTRADPSWLGTPELNFGRGAMPYHKSRGWFRGEADFPGPRTMAAAARWLAEDAPHHDRFFLFVDEFDPHEPFDTPEPYATMYDSDWEGAHLIWPPYAVGAQAKGMIDGRQAHQIRSCYGAKLTMIDHWFGRVLDALDRAGHWDDTAVILCTDHGHYLGEKDTWGKPAVPIQNPLGHAPLLIHWPGNEAAAPTAALTTAVDIHATIADVFDVEVGHRTHGRSLVPLLAGERTEVRDHVLTGMWSGEVHLIDDDHRYARAPHGENTPLTVYSNRWSTMPIHHRRELKMPPPDERATLARMPGSTVPVIRQPYVPGDLLPFWGYRSFDGSHLWRWRDDPAETEDAAGSADEKRLADRLRDALHEIEAPAEQLERLGL